MLFKANYLRRAFYRKICLLMKMTTILLLAICVTASANGFAQHVTLSLNNVKLDRVFKEIKKQAGYVFFYDATVLQETKPVSIHVKNKSVEEVLKESLDGQSLDFSVEQKTITIFRKAVSVDRSIAENKPVAPPKQALISGTVRDAEGNPLSGVTVLVRKTKEGASTEQDGSFTINANAGDVLEFSMIGYQSSTVTVGQAQNITVVLEQEIATVSEVVVVGYGTQKKRDVIGSISTIKSDVFESPSASTNFNSLMQGQAAGVSVQSSSGRLGANVDIKIRGLSSISANTNPLWVIDGVPIVTSTGTSNNGSAEQSPMNLINPSDIQSIDILKDAAATSIYGSRGSNGVIIVTTKSGKAGKASFNVGYNTGISDLPHQRVDFLLDSKKWFAIKDEAKGGFGLGVYNMNDFYAKKIYATEFLTREQAENIRVDWLKEGMRQGGFQSADFSTSGGTEAARYFVSGTYRKDKGIMLGEDLQRYGLRANVDLKPIERLLIGAKVNLSLSNGNRGKNVSGGEEDGNRSGVSGGFSQLNSTMVPFEPVYSLIDPYAYYNPYVNNPKATSDPKNLVEKLDMYRALTSLYAEYAIPFVTGLAARSEVSADIIQANRNFWVSKAIRQEGSLAQDGATTTSNINYNLYLKYGKSFGEHGLDLVAGTESQKGNRWIRSMQGRELVGVYQQLGAPVLRDHIFSGLSDENMLRSYFGRANYKYKDRYMAGVSIRRDGSSVFTPDYRWGNFVALSAGWIISDEAFMGGFGANNFLKLRGSWGQTGNANIPGKLDVTNYSGGFGYGGTDILGLDGTIAASIGVKNLEWEKTNNLDIGFDFGILNQRINGSVAYYNKYVKGLLLASALPPSSGMPAIWGNIGDLVNAGVELSFTSHNLSPHSKFGWSTTVNASLNRNEVKKLTPQVDRAGTGMAGSPFITKVGYSIREYFFAESAGIDPQTGLRMIYARDNDYYNETGETRRLVDANGKEVQLLATGANMSSNLFHQKGKSAMPTYYGGVTNRFSYKGFDLSFLITFSGGNYLHDAVYRDLIQRSSSGTGAILADFVDNYWKSPGDVAKYQRLDWLNNVRMEDGTIVGMGDPTHALDQWMFKGDFVKLKSVNLGYSLSPSAKLGKVFKGARLYCTLENLYTLTKYPGWDPEGQGYVSVWDIPQLFSATMGINVRF